MPIRTIAVHVADDPYGPNRVRLALALALRFDAHLDVVYTSPRVEMPASAVGRAMSMAYIEAMAEEHRGHVSGLLGETETICQDYRFWQWHMGKSDVEATIARYAHLSDLCVVEQPTREMEELSSAIPLSDFVYVAAGTPLLTVPPHWNNGDLGRHVLIVWKNSAEAISAVRSSLDFLGGAKTVHVAADPHDPHAAPPGSDLIAFLKRHGVAADLVMADPSSASELIDAARRLDGDLIVTGAIGHHGLRDLILGSTLDHLLRDAPVPVLLRR